MLDQPTEQATYIYITKLTNWTGTYFLSQIPNDKSDKNETHMSSPAIFKSGGLPVN